MLRALCIERECVSVLHARIWLLFKYHSHGWWPHLGKTVGMQELEILCEFLFQSQSFEIFFLLSFILLPLSKSPGKTEGQRRPVKRQSGAVVGFQVQNQALSGHRQLPVGLGGSALTGGVNTWSWD